MKLKNIFVALLCILLMGAMSMSILSIVTISNDYLNNKNDDGTSDDINNSPVDPGEDEKPGYSVVHLEGDVHQLASELPDGYQLPSGKYEVINARAMVRRINDIVYCYVKFDIPSDMDGLYISYNKEPFEDSPAPVVHRFSYDELNWQLLYDFCRLDGGDSVQAYPPRNGYNHVYVSFYTLNDSETSLEDILAEFEALLGDHCGLLCTNIRA